jgi:hypothetical protein
MTFKKLVVFCACISSITMMGALTFLSLLLTGHRDPWYATGVMLVLILPSSWLLSRYLCEPETEDPDKHKQSRECVKCHLHKVFWKYHSCIEMQRMQQRRKERQERNANQPSKA